MTPHEHVEFLTGFDTAAELGIYFAAGEPSDKVHAGSGTWRCTSPGSMLLYVQEWGLLWKIETLHTLRC